MIHQILLPLDLSEYSDSALEYASYFAEKHDAEAGIHSRRKIADFLVGSLCKHLIKKAKKPLFLG